VTAPRRGLAVAVIAAVLIAAGYWAWRAARPPAERLAFAARKALQAGDAGQARRLVERGVALYPDSATIRLAAAEVELESDRTEQALAHLEHARDDGSTAALNAIGAAGDLLFKLNCMSQAEERYRLIYERNPQSVVARQKLALLLALSGRMQDARQFFFEIIRGGRFDTHDLALLGNPEQVFDNPEFNKRFSTDAPDDRNAALGAAHYQMHLLQTGRAAELYRKLVARQPEDVDAQAGLGQALVEAGTSDEFVRWNERLPAGAEKHPGVWNARARFAQKQSEPETAIRCFWEVVRRDPNDMAANYQLALLLHQKGSDEPAGQFQKRAEQLKALQEVLRQNLLDDSHVKLLVRAGELCEAVGRLWEARGWYQAALDRGGDGSLGRKIEHLSRSIDDETPQMLAEADPVQRFDLSRFPLPVWKRSEVSPRERAPLETTPLGSRWMSRVTFRDDAREAGVDFTYHNGDDPAVPGMMIFESSGGGVAAIDFDGDFWPDLYFTQASDWPNVEGQSRYLDRLFRNAGDGHFIDVTAPSGLGDERFSQGVAAGDFNDDGFSDLYVANIGENRLYRNNGDGTFADCTLEARLKSGDWTTSVLVADLNGDGFPEIYDVTYVAGREPFEHVCHDPQVKNAPRICSPSVFAAEQDRLYVNRGDGTFEDVSVSAGILAPDGKGLGIAAGDFDGSGRVSLYVANDTTDNFLFINQTAHRGDLPAFAQQARPSGCAVDAEGRAQASMGIAVDDADGDGLADLFVTNFYNEYDALYRQLPGGLFADVTAQAGLKEPTLPTLGFGTQFIDGDLDGWPDLVVANGHVDDFSEYGTPFRMRAQFFVNLGGGRFSELPAGQLGDYFQRELLGRGMARLDWNRDGREDVAVSNLDTPAALVTNRSLETGHFLALQLRGVESNRDAIGAQVTARAAGRTRSKWMTAGDGYESSNQRQIVFGLGEAQSVELLTVRWPSGREQRFPDVAGDAQYILVEGRGLARLTGP
jgi:thioredoxin-like negative regulator of GroEL